MTSTEGLSLATSAPVLLSLGSNIEPRRNLPAAVAALDRQVQVIGVSRVFESVAVGGGRQPRFLNAAVAIETELEPGQLKFEVLRPLEAALGRIRSADKNAPRTIDLDIALFGALVINQPAPSLTIPDPDILTRAHVAIPLADLAPEAIHPVTGESLAEIAARNIDADVWPVAGLALWHPSDKVP